MDYVSPVDCNAICPMFSELRKIVMQIAPQKKARNPSLDAGSCTNRNNMGRNYEVEASDRLEAD